MAAIYWAEEGHRVIYIAPKRLESPQLSHHDRSTTNSESFQLMQFMYLSNYETLVEQLADLHRFASKPSVLILEDLDNYIQDPDVKETKEVHIARLCALLVDTMNVCAAILQQQVHICVSISSECDVIYQIYFNNFWSIEKQNNGMVKLKEVASNRATNKTFEYRECDDDNTGTLLVLNQIFRN
ncbi:uncharacterized protein LOC122511037 isoform X2 [Leptopilina heterotoma]|uniref:uncharacterized protein LOC122511037 isoform X2 n=1 Tax=Leptopilina heterotoma TaxID=63436 RepID=UPI001CA92A59|nr:uncharacterized protein LOC122511037 isoform X2 [Leptopilina heterotoma]